MSWREKKIITALATVLLLLIAAVVLALSIRYRENRPVSGEALPTQDGTINAVVNQNDYIALSYHNGNTTLSFSLDNTGRWIWDANRDFPLDNTVLTSILRLLINWTPQQTLTDPASLEAGNFSDPVGSLTATAANGKATHLLFGAATSTGNGRYIRLNGDETTAYILDHTLFELMSVPVYDMCVLPTLPELTDANLVSITLQGQNQKDGSEGLTTALTALRTEGSNSVSWRFNGANVTDLPVLQKLLEDLSVLAFSRCVDFTPSDKAATLCGFDSPAATVRVTYSTGPDTEGTLDLTIGNRLPDGSGRYVRLGEKKALYLLSTDLLDPMMHIAAWGLEN